MLVVAGGIVGEVTVLVTTPSLYLRKVAPIRDRVPTLRHVLVAPEEGYDLAELTGVRDLAALMDAASDRFGSRLSPWWWRVVPLLMVPVVAAGPSVSTGVQALLAVVAVGLALDRARIRPDLRRSTIVAALLLASGAVLGTLGDRTSLCRPSSILQGHALWHLLAAAGLEQDHEDQQDSRAEMDGFEERDHEHLFMSGGKPTD